MSDPFRFTTFDLSFYPLLICAQLIFLLSLVLLGVIKLSTLRLCVKNSPNLHSHKQKRSPPVSEEFLLVNYKSLLLLDQTTDTTPTRHELLFVPGPVLDKCHPLDRRAVDKTPKTTVVGTIAIV